MLPGSEDSAFADGRFVVDWSTFPFIRAAIVRAFSKDRYNSR